MKTYNEEMGNSRRKIRIRKKIVQLKEERKWRKVELKLEEIYEECSRELNIKIFINKKRIEKTRVQMEELTQKIE